MQVMEEGRTLTLRPNLSSLKENDGRKAGPILGYTIIHALTVSPRNVRQWLVLVVTATHEPCYLISPPQTERNLLH
jgi:hypothetical protein